MAKKTDDFQPRQYVCKTKCFFRNHLWTPGDTLASTPGEVVPEHFVVAEKYVAPVVVTVAEPKTMSEYAKKAATSSDDILA